MTYKIGKGQYAGKGGKNFPVTILDENGNKKDSFTVYGNHGTAKKEAEKVIKKLSSEE